MFKIVQIILFVLFIANLALLDYHSWQGRPSSPVANPDTADLKLEISELRQELSTFKAIPAASSSAVSVSNSCPAACAGLINSITSKVPPPSKPAPITSSTKESIINLGSGSTTNIGNWQDIDTAQATIDSSNYGSITEADFEVIMHLPTGEGEVRARLIDVTTPYVYDGNQVTTTASMGTLVSSPISMQPGKKVYKVQLLTTISAATLDEARIRIVSR